MADEEIRMVREKPLTLLLTLPDGCTPGRWESAEAFAFAIAEVREFYPDKTFQLLPFSYDTLKNGSRPSLEAILAVANETT